MFCSIFYNIYIILLAMYYILSTIVYPLPPTYPINLKSETMNKITLKRYSCL